MSDVEAETYAFRLFAPSKSSHSNTKSSARSQDASPTIIQSEPAPSISKIILDAPTSTADLSKDTLEYETTQVLGKRSRSLSYYIADPATPAQKDEFVASAVEGSDVQLRAQIPCYGCRYQWRVVDAISSQDIRKPGEDDARCDGTAAAEGLAEDQQEVKKRRSRKGKKTRIKLRVRMRAREEEKRRRKQEDVRKEQYLREKKTKMNRLKQIKKREKARREKGGGNVDANEAEG